MMMKSLSSPVIRHPRRGLLRSTAVHRRPNRTCAGTSVIVVIALVAIIALLLLVFLRALVREIDVEVARDEATTLKAYQQAFEAGVLREGYIPDPSGWVAMVATNMGAQTQDVAVNKRRQGRVLRR